MARMKVTQRRWSWGVGLCYRPLTQREARYEDLCARRARALAQQQRERMDRERMAQERVPTPELP